MAVICSKSYTSKMFTYTANDKTFSVEKSTLDGNSHDREGFCQVWDDACDEGIAIISAKTGKEAVFAVDQTHYTNDADHELTHWTLKPIRETLRTMPELIGVKVIVWND